MRRALRDGMILTTFGVVLATVIERALREPTPTPPATPPAPLADVDSMRRWNGPPLPLAAPRRY